MPSLTDPAVNFAWLKENPYPGRGLICGLSSNSSVVIQVYWIMGRSANSQNRVFRNEGPRVYTEPADDANVENPELIIYEAMLSDFNADTPYTARHVVSNGRQTGDVCHPAVVVFDQLSQWRYEPDKPVYTPRIIGVINVLETGVTDYELALLRRNELLDGDKCERSYFNYGDDSTLPPGVGMCLTTYTDDGDPPPSFTGEPLPIPLASEDPEEILATYWSALNPDYRVACAVKAIDVQHGTVEVFIANRFEKTEPATS